MGTHIIKQFDVVDTEILASVEGGGNENPRDYQQGMILGAKSVMPFMHGCPIGWEYVGYIGGGKHLCKKNLWSWE